jgi:hypothetical protein
MAEVPRLAIRPVSNTRPSLPSRRHFAYWDGALESMLAAPITAELDAVDPGWRKHSVLNADPRFNTSLRSRSSTADVRPDNRPDVVQRQRMVTRIVTSRLSPRKPVQGPKLLSISTDNRRTSDMHDHKTIELIIEKRQERENAMGIMKPPRKMEDLSLARQYKVSINPALRASFSVQHPLSHIKR